MNKNLIAIIPLVLAGVIGCSSTPSRDDQAMAKAQQEQAEAQARALAEQKKAEAERARLAELAAREAARTARPAEKMVFFDYDSDRLTPAFMELIAGHATHLSANPGTKVLLEGHADERGTQAYNVALGERRAKSVEQALLLRGASAGQLELVSYGESRPLVKGRTETSYAKNRRVVFVYK